MEKKRDQDTGRNRAMTPLVLVSGSGRSGTSLTMQILHACGLQVSDDLIGASEANPRGAWEDRAIFAEQTRLFEFLAGSALPRPPDWRATPLFADVKAKLDQVLRNRLSKSGSVWGFKDPKTCFLLPMWQELSEAHNCDLRFVWCVRRAENVVSSLMKNYSHTFEFAQNAYFLRNVYAMADSPSNTFVVHYGDLLRCDIKSVRELCQFCGLATEQSDEALRKIVADIADNRLNRSTSMPPSPLAARVRHLDETLDQLRGALEDLVAIRQAGSELLAPLQEWDFVIEAARAVIRDGRVRIVGGAQNTSFRKIERINEAYARENERLKQSSTRLRAEADHKISALRREIKRLQSELRAEADHKISALRREIKRLESELSEAGKKRPSDKQKPPSNKQLRQQLLAEVSKAFGRPGRMLKLPWKLVRVYRKHRRAAQRARAAKRR